MIFGQVLKNVRERHLNTSLNVLQERQKENRFPRNDKDFITSARVGRANFEGVSRGSLKRRNYRTLRPEFLTVPGEIKFERLRGDEVLQAYQTFLTAWQANVKLGTVSSGKKNHPYKYRNSLSFWINRRQVNAETMRFHILNDAEPTDIYRIINVAPHSSKLEAEGFLYGVYNTMRSIALDTRQVVSEAVKMAFVYYPSDSVGLTYGKGSGGPSGGQAVYALPAFEFSSSEANLKEVFVDPGAREQRRNRRRARRR